MGTSDVQTDIQRINELFDYVYQQDHNYAPSSHLNDVWRRPPDIYFKKLLDARNQPIIDTELLLDEAMIFLERESDTKRIIGLAVLGNDWQKDKDAAYLAHLVVDLNYSKMGYGSRLMSRIIDVAKNNGKKN
jgi:GNAT superfamily N-acetyltransferase